MDVLAFLTLDIQRPNISAIVYGMQGDRQSRAIRAQLVDGSTQWTPPAGTFFVISYAKPDGTHGIYSQTETGNAAVTISGSVATIALAEQVLTAAGDVPMTLTMFNADGERLSTFTWLLIVKPAAYSDAAFMSTDYYNLLTEQIAAVLKAQESIVGLTATATTLAPDSAATVTVTGGTGAEDPFNFEFGIPKGNTGSKGATGTAAKITAQIVEYQPGTSGTTAPTGAWSTTIPAVPAGQYLWTRTTITFNSGSPVVSYSVSRMGVDGTGSVKTVNNQSPDSSGDILLSSSNIPTPDFSSITAALNAKANSTDVTLEKLGAASNLNLLANWWFGRGVINQKNITDFILNTIGIDRWKLVSGSATVTENGILLNGTIEQTLENPVGTNVHASTLMYSGTAASSYDDENKIFSITSNGGIVKAAKLEYGTISTIANDHAPDFASELLKCQRFLLPLSNYVRYPVTRISQSEIDFLIPIPIGMRATPVIDGTATVYSGTAAQTGFTFAVTGNNSNALTVRGTKQSHGLTVVNNLCLQVTSCMLNAEL